MADLTLKNRITTQHLGRNTTFRSGVRDVKPGDRVYLCQVDGVRFGVGCVLAVHILPFIEVTRDMLAKAHNPACQTFVGLWDELKRVYGQSFGLRSTVTVIDYSADAYDGDHNG